MSKTQDTKNTGLFSARDILGIYDICTDSVDAVYQIALICGIEDFIHGLNYLKSAIPTEPDDLLIDPRVLVNAPAGEHEVELKATVQPSSVETNSDATLSNTVPLRQQDAASISRTLTESPRASDIIQYYSIPYINDQKTQQNSSSASSSAASLTVGVSVQPAITAEKQPRQAAVHTDPLPLQLSSASQGATSHSVSLTNSSKGTISNPGNRGSYKKNPISGNATESRHRVAQAPRVQAPSIRRTMTAPSPKITAPFKPSPLRTQLSMGNESSSPEEQRRAPSAQSNGASSSSGPKLTPPPLPMQSAAEVPHSAIAMNESRISSPRAQAQAPTSATHDFYAQLPESRSTNSTEHKSNDTKRLDTPVQSSIAATATVSYHENTLTQAPPRPQSARAQAPHRAAVVAQAVQTPSTVLPQHGYAQQLPQRYHPNTALTAQAASRQYIPNSYTYYALQGTSATTPYTLSHVPRQYTQATDSHIEASLAAEGFAIIENPDQQRQMAAPIQSSLGKRRAEVTEFEPGYPEKRPIKRARCRA